MSYLLDTNVLRSPLSRDPAPELEAWLAARDAQDLYTCTIVIGEVAYGIGRLPPGRRRQALQAWLRHLTDHAFAGRILPFDQDAALAFGLLASSARAQGHHPGAQDAQIAAIALVTGMTLATRNLRHFTIFEGLGLRVVDPFSGPE